MGILVIGGVLFMIVMVFLFFIFMLYLYEVVCEFVVFVCEGDFCWNSICGDCVGVVGEVCVWCDFL